MRIARQITMMVIVMLPVLALAGKGPRITFDKTNHDYGKVLYGETVTEEFTFTNSGDEPLIIEKLSSSCGCTKAVKGSREVPPKGKSKIVAAFDTTGFRPGRKVQTVTVHSNDPNTPEVTLTLSADVVREINVEPPSLAKQLPTFVSTISFPMHIGNSSDKTCTVKGFRPQPDGVQTFLKPSEISVEPGGKTPFSLVFRLKKEPGRHYYMGKVVLLTDHPKEKEAEIRYLIKIDKTE